MDLKAFFARGNIMNKEILLKAVKYEQDKLITLIIKLLLE